MQVVCLLGFCQDLFYFLLDFHRCQYRKVNFNKLGLSLDQGVGGFARHHLLQR